ncbi:MAG: RNA polymerase sigma factor [Phycisphaerae bacterium]
MSRPSGKTNDVRRPQPAVFSDADLVRQARSGRREAYDDLIQRHQRRATAVAFRLVGNLHDALEVCQNAFVRAYRNLETLESPDRFGSWLLRIVTNLSLNFRRDRAVGGKRVSLDDCISEDHPLADRLADPPYSDQRPGAGIAAQELADRLALEMARLPDQQRIALTLFSIENMPQRDVADVMGCSVEAVKWHVFQARKRLKERLAEFL